jgi:hypothetical protein
MGFFGNARAKAASENNSFHCLIRRGVGNNLLKLDKLKTFLDLSTSVNDRIGELCRYSIS